MSKINHRLLGLSLAACLGMAGTLHAGKIVSVPQGAPSAADGFGGWNLDNVAVLITDTDYNPIAGKAYNETDGSYSAMTYGNSFESRISDDIGTVMAKLHGKDWPVGEPSGVKVLNDIPGTQNGKPGNCIMTTSYLDTGYLDTASPEQTTCASPFQTHKRFKVNMLPTTVPTDVGGEKSIDLVFNVEADGGTVRRYEVFQKINNYTDKRLDGYTVQVGFGVGANFVEANSTQDLSLSLGIGENDGADIWGDDEMATFSHGLWGAPDKHFPDPGFFGDSAAGYYALLVNGNKEITSNGALPSTYDALFGKWLPSKWQPTGIFFDNDNDPTTDAELVAFWSDYDGSTHTGTFTWRRGDADSFAAVDSVTLTEWALNPQYGVSNIEDTLNLGLNYIVNVGDVSTFPGNAFTIHITPKQVANADQTVPGWAGNEPTLDYNSSTGVVAINPAPTFVPGTALTVGVADGDLNVNPDVNDTVDINVTTDQGEVETVTLTEIDVNTGIFRGTLETNNTTATGTDNDGILNVTEGTVVTATYHDANTSAGVPATVTATTTAETSVTPPSSDKKKNWFAVNDKISLIFTILAFLAIGGLVARRKLA